MATSIFFVWVVRYNNIIQEFKQYGLPEWLRDLVGILKLTFSLLLLLGGCFELTERNGDRTS